MSQKHSQRGFTIIELLIATMIFSVILIAVSAAVLRFAKQYYKGVISNQTQSTARAIMDDISRSVQFNAGTVYILTSNDISVPFASPTAPNPPVFGYCIGDSKRYSFVENRQVSDTPDSTLLQSRYGLVSDNITGCSTNTRAIKTTAMTRVDRNPAQPLVPLNNPRELLGQHMRLNKLSIDEDDGVYAITVKVVYGDNDLLCSPSTTNPASGKNSCEEYDPSNTAVYAKDDLRCRLVSGAQFCAVSELSTSVKKRVN
ncbi:MAG TPA: type II secretion system protein [Candidatus Limnocylindrales bacterium]|nr:type II secretion system protein [Candidatus Limnocylindrales bacterium]